MSNATTLQTNNNKLSANNTDLASILNTINNLPEAGTTPSGGELQVATGTLSVSIGKYASGNTIATVTGLNFTPKHVAITMSGDGCTLTDYGNTYFVGMQFGLFNTQNYGARINSISKNGYVYGGNKYYGSVSGVINSDGFTIVSNSSNLYAFSEYNYIAIG